MKKEKKSPLSKAMSLAVKTRNAMPKYGPKWRKKIAQKANKASTLKKREKKFNELAKLAEKYV